MPFLRFIPNLSLRLRQLFRHFSLETLSLIGNFLLIIFLALLTPLFIRYWGTAKFIEHEEVLEFTFQTCGHDLSGVCSFPEAVIALDEVRISALIDSP